MKDFVLLDSFLAQYKGKQPDFGPIGLIVYKRSYARPIYEENRTEEFWETLRRVVEGCYSIQKQHCKSLRLPWNDHKGQSSAQEMFNLMWEMKFLPPGRGLWAMGSSYIEERKTSAPLFNCSFHGSKDINIDFAEPFCFTMDMSMLGVGGGGDTEGAGKVKIRKPYQGDYALVVEDNREGWVNLIRVLLDTYVGKGSLPSSIDYSKVRPAGAPIKTFGGVSGGPGPLIQLVKDIHSILQPLIGRYITSAAIIDLYNAIGRCVVSGNLRRTALIMLGHADDMAFLDLKNPNINQDRLNKWGWTSNNTIKATIGMDYSIPAEMTALNGEPGYWWQENAQRYGRMIDPPNNLDEQADGTNACGEITLYSAEMCNVPETFPARHETLEEYKRTLKYAYLYGKTVSLLSTHNEKTNAIQLRNRRLGISQSGIAQAIAKRGIREHCRWCDEGYRYLKQLDKIYSHWLCVPESIKLTAVKPSGSISTLPNATPGIHYPFAEYYLRAIRVARKSSFATTLEKAGYIVEDDLVDPSSAVVYFPIKEKDFERARKDLSMWEQLELTAQMQAYWADNQVSVTITFKPEEAKDIERALELYGPRLKSVSFLPLQDHGYPQAPYQQITKERYEELTAKLRPFSFDTTETQGDEKTYCDSDRCEIVRNK